VLEGWCLGVPAEDEAALAQPLNALEREEDPDGRWRRWCNQRLGADYPPLWAQVDVLWYLQPPGFDQVLEWRTQQERQLQADQPGRPGMGPAQLACFVQHFERVSRQALRTLPGIAAHVARLDRQRRLWPAQEPAQRT